LEKDFFANKVEPISTKDWGGKAPQIQRDAFEGVLPIALRSKKNYWTEN